MFKEVLRDKDNKDKIAITLSPNTLHSHTPILEQPLNIIMDEFDEISV